MTTPRLTLAQLPTPLEPAERLSAAWGGPTIWIKRDDLTGFGLSGNKVRKLEFHMHAARAAGATAVGTCGAVQSNHCRATALVAARLGLDCELWLRSRDGSPPADIRGNHLLQRLAGAKVHFLSTAEYRSGVRDQMSAAAAEHGAMWLMPAGASDRLGMESFVHAFDEFADQWRELEVDVAPTVWHASSSGGTSAGLALGAARSSLDCAIVGSSVGETHDELWNSIDEIATQAGLQRDDFGSLEILDDHVGLGYGRTTPDELAIQVEATRLTGLIWDPTYTGKAVVALKREVDAGRFSPEQHVVLWHTGGGFAAFAHDFGEVL